jgi:DNA-binding transcriptional LysR family regulator
LLADAVDLAVYEPTPDTPPVDDPRIDQEPLLDDPFDLLVPAGHSLAAADRVTLDQAARQDWVVEMAPSSSRHYTLAACTATGFSPRLAHQARQWNVVATLVGYGLGVALVPQLAQLPALPVVRVPLRGRPVPSRRLLIATRRGSAAHPVLAAAVTALHTAADQPRPAAP